MSGDRAGEPYDGAGLDGVPVTPQASAGGYDTVAGVVERGVGRGPRG